MRFVNTLITQQEKDHKDLNKMLLSEMDPTERNVVNDQCLDEFVKYMFLICKRCPTVTDLKRYLVKTEIDQQIVIKKRDDEIFKWQNNRNNIF